MSISMSLKLRRGKTLFQILALACTVGVYGCGSDKNEDFQAEGRKLMEQGNPGGAVVFFKNALETDPTDFSLRMDLAKAYLQFGKIPQAEEEFQKCLRQKPDDPLLHFEMAKLYALLRDDEKVFSHLRAAETSGIEVTGEMNELKARALSWSGKFSEAEQELLQALEKAPDRRSAAVGLGHVYLNQNRTSDAQDVVEKLLTQAPSLKEALHLQADIALRLEDTDKAIQVYRKLREVAPGDEDSAYMLGVLLLQKGDKQGATEVLENMRVRFKSTARISMLNGFIAFEEGRFQDAANSFQRSVEIQPTVDGYYRLALALRRIGSTELALSNLRRVLDVAPEHGRSLQLTAQIFREQGRLNEARVEAEKLVTLYPEVADGHYLLGQILHEIGDSEASLLSLQKALNINPAMSEATLAKSSILLSQKRFSEVTEELNKALEVNAEDVATRSALFNYYLGRRDRASAWKVVKDGLKATPEQPMLLTHEAMLYAIENNEAEALKALGRARKAEPDFLPALNLELRLHMAANRNDKALEICDTYLASHPEDLDKLIASASLLSRLERHEEARARLRKAESLGSEKALILLVRDAIADKRIEDAEHLFLEAMRTKPSSGLRFRFAEFYMGQGMPDKAHALYSAIAAQAPVESALGEFQLFSASGKYGQALEKARTLATLDQNSSLGAVCIADALEKMGKGEEALLELDKAYQAKPETGLLVAMGELCTRIGQFDKAEAYFGTALKQSPDNLQVLMGQGYVAMQKKEYGAAIASYEKAMELDPENMGTVNNLAMAYAEEGRDTGKAVMLASKVFAANPNDAGITDTLAVCLIADGRMDDAVHLLSQAVLAHPGSPVLRYRLGTALIKADKKKEGVKELQKAIELGTFDESDIARKLIKNNS